MTSVKFAVIDVNDFLSKKQASDPELAADWAKLEELYNKKLWHQLTLKLDTMVKMPQLQKDDNLIQLYNNCITTFENKINPLSLIEIVAHIVRQYTDKKAAIAFLEKIEAKVKSSDDALALCKVLQGQIYLEHLKDMENTKRIIEHLENTLEDADGVTPVHGRFYQLASHYYKLAGPLSKYYRCALRFVGCSQGGETMDPDERRQLALCLAVAALLAEDVYNLGELLAHPILECLGGTAEEWAALSVKAFASGNLQAFEELRPHWTKVPDLAANELKLRQKLAVLCLMEMAFNRTADERQLTFEEIARETRLPIDEVELLVMKALANKLIKGEIDQVNGTVRVWWVRPRALTRAQVAAAGQRLEQWCKRVDKVVHLSESHAKDLLAL